MLWHSLPWHSRQQSRHCDLGEKEEGALLRCSDSRSNCPQHSRSWLTRWRGPGVDQDTRSHPHLRDKSSWIWILMAGTDTSPPNVFKTKRRIRQVTQYENKTVLPVVTWTLRDAGLEDPGGNGHSAVSLALAVILNHSESCGNIASLSWRFCIISLTLRPASLLTSVKHRLYRNLEINQLIRTVGSWREYWLELKRGQMLFAKLTGSAFLEKFHKKSDI